MTNPTQTITQSGHTQSDNQGPIIKGVKKRIKPSKASVIALIDATGSSDAYSKGIVEVNEQLLEQLPQRIGSVQWGLHVCRDLEYDQDADFSLGMGISTDILATSLNRIEFIGGGDSEETQLDSVLTIAQTYEFDPSILSRRALCIYTSSDSKPTRCGKGVPEVADVLNKFGIAAVIVAPRDCNLHALSEDTGGVSIELSNTPDSNDIQRVVALLTASLTQMATRTQAL